MEENEEEKDKNKKSCFQLGGVDWIPVPMFDTWDAMRKKKKRRRTMQRRKEHK